jgi:hypothetical protein
MTYLVDEYYDNSDEKGIRWSDPALRAFRDELVADLRAHLPAGRAVPLPVAAPT